MRVKLIENWTHELPRELAREFRDAIDAGDLLGLKESSIDVLEQLIELLEEDAYAESWAEDLLAEFSALDASSDEDDYDVLLDELYDLLDENNIWLGTF